MNLTFSYLRNQEAGIKELYIFNQGSNEWHAVLFVVGFNSFLRALWLIVVVEGSTSRCEELRRKWKSRLKLATLRTRGSIYTPDADADRSIFIIIETQPG